MDQSESSNDLNAGVHMGVGDFSEYIISASSHGRASVDALQQHTRQAQERTNKERKSEPKSDNKDADSRGKIRLRSSTAVFKYILIGRLKIALYSQL